MFCDFINIDDFTYKCLKCGTTISSFDSFPPVFPCSTSNLLDNTEGDLVNKLKDFAKENLSDIDSLAPDSLIEHRHRICETCEFLNNSSCSKCGCIISRTRDYINKLSSLDSNCPMNKW